jgi:hypothetical protein
MRRCKHNPVRINFAPLADFLADPHRVEYPGGSMLSFSSKSKLAAKVILIVFAFSLIGAAPLPAQERYPAVARLSFISGPVTYSRGDDPDEWDDAIENVPLTIGDRIYAPEDGRAELQLSSGNFVRLAPRSYLSTLNLSDDIKQFYLGEGVASFNIRRLQSDEVIEIDTPNVSVTLEEPGQYRVAVDEDGNSRITVWRGRVIVAASGRQVAVENSEIRVYGIDSPRYEIVGLPATDAFDRWVSERDDRFERAYSDAYRYASEDIVGAEDLADYGRWEAIPEYGYAWTPSRVAAGWAPFSDGRWYWQDPWGWSWISNERWGWATSHYGRWTPYRSRWYWVPVRPRTRVRYAPAVVEFVRVRDHVGWFPLHPRDRHIPWWERRDRQRFDRNVTYVNRTFVTVINHNHFVSARPVRRYIVRDSVIVQEVRSARFTSDSLPIPNRSSLRVVSENGGRRGHRPSDKIVNRAAVVRTAVPASPRAFRDKLPEIQKNQGKAVEPARILAATQDDRARAHARVRSAAETNRGNFAPRNPGANAGPAPQPLTEARDKNSATREESGANSAERTDRAQKTAAPPAQTAPSKGTAASRPETPRLERDRDRPRQAQQEIERQKQAQQKKNERKAQLEKQEQQLQERQGQEQKQRELARRQAQQKEEERKAWSQEQARREQLRQQQLQERQAQQQRQQELQRRQQQQEQERKAKAQAQQKQQEQARREQLRASQQQRQEQARAQQLRQQQAQAQREAQQAKRQQEQERQPQPRQPQQNDRQVQQTPRLPGKF